MPYTACHRAPCAQPRSRRRHGTLLQEGMRLMCYCARHVPLLTPDKSHARGAAARQVPSAKLLGKASQASKGSLASAKSTPVPQQSSRCVFVSLVTIGQDIPFGRVPTAHWLSFLCAIGVHANTRCTTSCIWICFCRFCASCCGSLSIYSSLRSSTGDSGTLHGMGAMCCRQQMER
jgi:hypothetical protein